MSNDEAHKLLNAAKRGANVTRQQIDEALRVTGDLVEYAQPFRAYRAAKDWTPQARAEAAT